MFKFLVLSAIMIGSAIMALAFPNAAAAKCPDQDGVVCTDLRFGFLPNQLVAGKEGTVTAQWFNERTGTPVAEKEWLAEAEPKDRAARLQRMNCFSAAASMTPIPE